MNNYTAWLLFVNPVQTLTEILVDGTIDFYHPGTIGESNRKDVYLDPIGSQIAANPYTLDGNATAILYGLFAEQYHVVIKNKDGDVKFDIDYTTPDSIVVTFGALGQTRQFFTATEGQTLFTLTGSTTYTSGINNIAIYVDGRRQYNDAYIETTGNSFTMTEPLAAGQVVMAVINEVDGSGGLIGSLYPETGKGVIWDGYSANSIAELRLMSGFTGASIQVAGYYTPGDGGGGPLRVWKTGAVGFYVDNGGSIIVPTGGDGSGAWVWEYSGAVNVKWFGAKEGIDSTTQIQAALNIGVNIYVPEGLFDVTGLTTGHLGQMILGAGEGISKIRNSAGIGTTLAVEHWHVGLENFQINGGTVGIAVGDALIKCNFATFRNVYVKSATTGIKVSNGNVGRMFGGFVESCTVGVHFTDETMDTNGWTVYGTRAYACGTGYYLQGNVNNRFADDNFFTVTSEDYTAYGFRCSGIRNILNVYAESTAVGAVGVWDETSYKNHWTINGDTDIKAGTSFHGLSQSVSPTRYVGVEQSQYLFFDFDVTPASASYQNIGDNHFATIINTSGALRTINLQLLAARPYFNNFYFRVPSSNTGDISLVLNDPAGFTFKDGGSSTYLYGSTRDRYFRLARVAVDQSLIEELFDYDAPVNTLSLQVDSSANFSMRGFLSGACIRIQNDSGASRVLTLADAAGIQVGFEITFFQDAASSTITLTLPAGQTFITGGTTRAMGGATGNVLRKVKADKWIVWTVA